MKTYREIANDGGSGVVEQVVAQRRRIADGLAGVRHRVAIGSGKGGVGKSTLTHALAAELARGGARVAVLDADLNGPCQARIAGLGAVPLVPEPDGLLAMPVSSDGVGVVSLGALVPRERSLEFDSVAEGDSQVWRATREFTLLGQLLGSVRWGNLDYLMVDLPPGAERTVQYAEFLGPATWFVLVTIPAATSREVVTRSLAALRRTPNRVLGYVENMDGYACGACGEVRPLFPGAEPLDLPCLGRVPFDPRLTTGDAAERSPTGALGAVAEIASRIARALEEAE